MTNTQELPPFVHPTLLPTIEVVRGVIAQAMMRTYYEGFRFSVSAGHDAVLMDNEGLADAVVTMAHHAERMATIVHAYEAIAGQGASARMVQSITEIVEAIVEAEDDGVSVEDVAARAEAVMRERIAMVASEREMTVDTLHAMVKAEAERRRAEAQGG